MDRSLDHQSEQGGAGSSFLQKPEALLHRCLELASKLGDWIIDPFCGSGTTAAVAHKMGRSWVTIDCEEHLLVQAKPRLDAVVAGQDAGGSLAGGLAGVGAVFSLCTTRHPVGAKRLLEQFLRTDQFKGWDFDLELWPSSRTRESSPRIIPFGVGSGQKLVFESCGGWQPGRRTNDTLSLYFFNLTATV